MINYKIQPTYLDFNFEGYLTTDQIKISDRVASRLYPGLCPQLEEDLNRDLMSSSSIKLPSEFAIAKAIMDVLNNSVFSGKNTLDEKAWQGLTHIFKGIVGSTVIFYQFVVDENSKHRVTVDIDLLSSNIILIFNGRRSSDTGIRLFDNSLFVDEDFSKHITDNKLGGLNQGIYNTSLVVPNIGWDIENNISKHPYLLYINNKNKKSNFWRNKDTIVSKILYRVIEPFTLPMQGEHLKIKIGTSFNTDKKKFDNILGEVVLSENSNTELGIWKSDILYSIDLKKLGYFRISNSNQIGLTRTHSFTAGKIEFKVFYDLASALTKGN